MGWAATQLSKTVAGVRVIGLAGPSKHSAIRANGVDVCINSLDNNWSQAVKSACPRGVDIAIDVTSGHHFQQSQDLLNDLGRAILIGTHC